MKKIYFAIILAILAIPFVLAQPAPFSTIGNLFEKNLGWLFMDFTDFVGIYFWLRFMIWIVLFSIFYAVLIGFVPPFKGKKNTTLPVAIVMALICAIFITDGILISIGKAYGAATAILLMAAPIGGAIYLIHVVFPTSRTDKNGNPRLITTRKVNHAIKAILYYLIFTILGNYIVAARTDVIFGGGGAAAEWGAMIQAFCLIAMLYHLFAAIFISEGEAGGGAEEGEGWLTRLIREGRGRAAPGQPPQAPVDLREIEARITQLSEHVEQFNEQVREFMEAIQNFRNGQINENALETVADSVREAGERVEVAFANVIGHENFARLEEANLTNVEYIVRRYRVLLEGVITAINGL